MAAMDFKKVNKLTEEILEEIFKENIDSKDIKGFKERNLFTGAYTPEGFVDYIDTIISDVDNKYYIQGEIGTGKSTLLNRILDCARIRNYKLEIFRNPFIPEKIETLFIKELNTIISSNELIKNNNFKTVDLNLFSKIDKDIELYSNFEQLVNKGVYGLSKAKNNHNILESSYKVAVDYTGVERARESIWQDICKLNRG